MTRCLTKSVFYHFRSKTEGYFWYRDGNYHPKKGTAIPKSAVQQYCIANNSFDYGAIKEKYVGMSKPGISHEIS